jgi:hypothetical protein
VRFAEFHGIIINTAGVCVFLPIHVDATYPGQRHCAVNHVFFTMVEAKKIHIALARQS